ncbi:Choline-sulfatase [Caulifigura coniformis]|uniref:Choline-sulfatase n=1 Tax=Caulifigura coniformis TaxID=2527983 RepID=A0A517SB64_9PLAN|nr:sulfatase-like hydrolase/transferase [Caulifigura coniformis]QDT53316.1 Choline-sulfatase [Caulifigura coniformis]
MIRTALIALIVGLLLAKPTHAAPPNFVLCMADDQGWGDMAYNGHPALKTPVFDELAKSAWRFDRFYAAAPVCSPTRASVMTGRTPNRMGAFSWGWTLRPQEITVAEALKSAGYATGHFGKWHLGSLRADSPVSPGQSGFDTWLSSPNFFEIDPWMCDNGKAVQMKGEGSEVIVARALRFIEQQQQAGKPFLAVIWFGSPHNPHVGIEQDLALYQDQPKKQRHFLAEITAMDRAMGQLRDGLRQHKAAENTLLWYCSDNGAIPEGSTGGLRGKKGNLYEGGLRVPALMEWPARLKDHRRIDVPCCTVDIYPTLIELAGTKVEKQPVLDGISLVPLLDGQLSKRNKPIGFWDYATRGLPAKSADLLQELAAEQAAGQQRPAAEAEPIHPDQLRTDYPDDTFPRHSAWLDGDWKLHRIEPPNGKLKWELYNLKEDEKETTDLLAKEPDRAAKMQTDLQTWLKSVVASLNGADN